MSKIAVCALSACAAATEVYFEEDFSKGIGAWTHGFPAGKEMGKWVSTSGNWFVDEEANKGMATSEDMRFHSISAKMTKPSSSVKKELVIQFSAKY